MKKHTARFLFRLKGFMEMGDPYKSKIPDAIRILKTIVQFLIGASLLTVLTAKGFLELMQTLEIITGYESRAIHHILGIHTFSFIASALAISAGIDLSYMLFTDGPDEALSPLMLCITSAAFYTVSDKPSESWIIGVYSISILVLMYCMKKYKDWGL